MVVAYSTTLKWRKLAANFLPYFPSILSFLFSSPPAFHSQKLVCQTDPLLMNCLLENCRNHWQAVVRLWWESVRWRENMAHHLCDTGGGCKLEFRGALYPINSSSFFCKRQWICSVMLMQGARYLLRILFVKLGKRQALEEGRNFNFSGFVFLIEIQSIDAASYQFLTLKKKSIMTLCPYAFW